jgi:TPR repeat protein
VRTFASIGGAALAAAATVLLLLRLASNGGTPSDPRPASTAPAPSASMGAMDARQLGFRLLASADTEEIHAGMETLSRAAEAGDVEAEVALGRIFLRGLPAVPKDAARARDWFLRAEAAHHPSAAYFLGVMSQNGEGVKADPAAAARFLEVAAQEGQPHAMFLLANAYRAGAGVPKDEAKALTLYENAGEMEHPAALQALALAYQHGELGLSPDEAESRRYAMEAEHAIKHPPPPP